MVLRTWQWAGVKVPANVIDKTTHALEGLNFTLRYVADLCVLYKHVLWLSVSLDGQREAPGPRLTVSHQEAVVGD